MDSKCKDCKHWNPEAKGAHGEKIKGYGSCIYSAYFAYYHTLFLWDFCCKFFESKIKTGPSPS